MEYGELVDSDHYPEIMELFGQRISDQAHKVCMELSKPKIQGIPNAALTAKDCTVISYVVANSDGDPLSYSQFKRLWQYVTTRSTQERYYIRYVNGQKVRHKVKPVLGEKAAHNSHVVYSMDFKVTPHQLRHTYITNLIYASVDPKTVQYLAGHENIKITMDIYAKVKYNRPEQLVDTVTRAFA